MGQVIPVTATVMRQGASSGVTAEVDSAASGSAVLLVALDAGCAQQPPSTRASHPLKGLATGAAYANADFLRARQETDKLWFRGDADSGRLPSD
jgi:hypothetical protein